MILGFAFASYSVVGNDVIQTLGTFLSSNEDKKWYILWAYVGGILLAVLVYGWATGDISYGKFGEKGLQSLPEHLSWWYILPPVTLVIITRFGVPVSTTFLVLSVFSVLGPEFDSSDILSSDSLIGKMLVKSVQGYIVAFLAACAIYLGVSQLLEKRFIQTEMTLQEERTWTVLQWISTGFLWSQWLSQDLANIYVYLPRQLDVLPFIGTVVLLIGLLGYILYQKGGAVQKVVLSKTNTTDIRSATTVDFIYGIILFVFKYDVGNFIDGGVPMSTTWVFIGLLAGREFMISLMLKSPKLRRVTQVITLDLAKVFAGLVVSIILVYIIAMAEGVS